MQKNLQGSEHENLGVAFPFHHTNDSTEQYKHYIGVIENWIHV